MYQLEKMALAQYLETEFSGLRLVLSRWVTFKVAL